MMGSCFSANRAQGAPAFGRLFPALHLAMQRAIDLGRVPARSRKFASVAGPDAEKGGWPSPAVQAALPHTRTWYTQRHH